MPRREQVSRTLTRDYTFDINRTSNSASTHNLRLRVALPSVPGAAVPTRPEFFPAAACCRFSSASPAAPDCNPPRDASLTRHQQGFTVIHPTPAFPSPVTPDGTGPLGFPLSFAPSRAGPGNARQGGDRPGHCLDHVPGISQPPSTYSLTTCDLTSQRTGDLYAAACNWYIWPTPKLRALPVLMAVDGRLLMRGPVGLVCRAPDRYSGRCDVGVHPEEVRGVVLSFQLAETGSLAVP